MRKLVVCILFLSVLIPLAPLGASADTVIPNTTQVLPYNGTKASTASGYNDWMSSIPLSSLFTIYGYSVEYTSPTNLTLKIYTNMLPGGDTSISDCPVGNLALNLGGNFSTNGFTQALVLPTTGTGGTLLDVTSWDTSQTLWSSRTAYIYGGEYRISPTSASSGAAPVQATGTIDTSSTITASWSSNSAHPGDGNEVLTILFSGLGDNDGHDLIFLWTSGTCSNGAIFADIPLFSRAPLPPSALLLGTGLLGLMGLGWRRRKTNV